MLIIGRPLAAEQAINSKMLVEEMGVCIELTKTGVENSIVREEVKRVIDLVDKNGKKGQEMKKKAVEIGELIKAAVRKEEGRRGLLFKQWMILFLPFSQLLRLEGNHFVLGGHGLNLGTQKQNQSQKKSRQSI